MVIKAHIITPDEHPISLEMIDDEALFVMRKLNRAGFSSYLVGGGVRDLYLGKTPKDFDISTDARPGQIRRLFSNSRTIGRRFRLVQVFFKNNKIIEVSTLRSLSEHDIEGPQAVLAPNNTYGSLAEDAQRRDISINALFYEIENQNIIDHVGGVKDLERCLVRIIGSPDQRISRDPVRMMRVIRHSARIDFVIEEPSWQAVCQSSPKLTMCPPSRLRDELFKDLYSGVSARWYELSVMTGIFVELFQIYKNLMTAKLPDGALCREQLSAIFRTIDRLNDAALASGNHRQPDYFILAFILIPWAAITFDITGRAFTGAQLFQLSKKIRAALDVSIGPALNLQRSARQEITTLLAQLPVFIQYQQQQPWPKWLKRKSYFAQCRLLHLSYREALDGTPVPDVHFINQKEETVPANPRRRKKGSKRKGGPALSGNRGGGIFGFKR